MAPVFVRDEPLLRWIVGAFGWWAILFGIVTAFMGELSTSKPWMIAMSIPGTKWSWAILFVTAGILSLLGVHNPPLHRVTSVGLALMGFGCFAIAAVFLLAPLLYPDVITEGYFPWILAAGLMFTGAVAYWRKTPWP